MMPFHAHMVRCDISHKPARRGIFEIAGPNGHEIIGRGQKGLDVVERKRQGFGHADQRAHALQHRQVRRAVQHQTLIVRMPAKIRINRVPRQQIDHIGLKIAVEKKSARNGPDGMVAQQKARGIVIFQHGIEPPILIGIPKRRIQDREQATIHFKRKIGRGGSIAEKWRHARPGHLVKNRYAIAVAARDDQGNIARCEKIQRGLEVRAVAFWFQWLFGHIAGQNEKIGFEIAQGIHHGRERIGHVFRVPVGIERSGLVKRLPDKIPSTPPASQNAGRSQPQTKKAA